MPLTLIVRNIDRASSAAPPPPLRLDRRGAVIGRSADADWTLADARNTISSRHCEIAWRDGGYWITDTSTNGTALNGNRLSMPQQLAEGDLIGVGPYELVVSLHETPLPVSLPIPPTVQRTQAPTAATAFPSPASPPQGTQAGGAAIEQFARSIGLRRADLPGADPELLANGGALLRQLAEGVRALLAARSRARAELGVAPGPGDGAHPLTRAGTTEQALAALLAPGAGARPLVEAFADLEAHQRAILTAMQGAMTATLDRFSPAAIRAKAGAKAGDAALWQAYEGGFTGEHDRDAAFIEVFARELRAAYEALDKRSR